MRLFVESARRVLPGFALAGGNQTAVIEICHLVGGMPLALEIAGAWMRLMPEAAVAAEIQQNLGFLATPMRDLPERHRSMTAVFAYIEGFYNRRRRHSTLNYMTPIEYEMAYQLCLS